MANAPDRLVLLHYLSILKIISFAMGNELLRLLLCALRLGATSPVPSVKVAGGVEPLV